MSGTGGVFTSANVLLTSGSMQALDLIGKVLIDVGDLVVAQSPTYEADAHTMQSRRRD